MPTLSHFHLPRLLGALMLVLFVFGLSTGCSQQRDLALGQTWFYYNRSGEKESTIQILHIERNTPLGDVYFVSVRALDVKRLGRKITTTEVWPLVFTHKALTRSLLSYQGSYTIDRPYLRTRDFWLREARDGRAAERTFSVPVNEALNQLESHSPDAEKRLFGYEREMDILVTALSSNSLSPRLRAVKLLLGVEDPRGFQYLIKTVRDNNADIKVSTIQSTEFRFGIERLTEDKTQMIVEALIASLTDKDKRVREAVVDALGRLQKHPSAIEALISALADGSPEVKSRAAKSLGSFDYERSRVDQVLLAALRKKDLEIISGAYEWFIRKGISDSEVLLMQALEKYGDKEMAIAFINSGNPVLADAGREWAKKRGFGVVVIQTPSGASLKWRSGR